MNYTVNKPPSRFIELTAIEKFSDRCITLVSIDHIILIEPLDNGARGNSCRLYLTGGTTLVIDSTLASLAEKLTG